MATRSLLLAILLIGACARGTVQRCSTTVEGIELSVSWVGAHWYLAEYDRSVTIRAGGQELIAELSKDTGGYSAVDVFRASTREYWLHDQFGWTRVVIIAGKLVASQEPAPNGAGFARIGRFDLLDGSAQFVSHPKTG
jgi:hypothetical protein